MAIQRLNVSGIRNLSSVALLPSSGVNLFFGDNGSGKTSLLEAVHFLAVARSFKTNRLRPVIRKGNKSCTVYGEVIVADEVIPVGVTRSLNARQVIKVNGCSRGSVAELACLLPVQLMNPDTFNCLQGGAVYRRRLLDWGVFHQNSVFFSVWKKMQVSLKQRNSLLRCQSYHSGEMAVWTKTFISAAQVIDQLRTEYMNALIEEVEGLLLGITNLCGLKLSYSRGWSKGYTLEEVLDRDMNKDLALGYTTSGPQRSDIRATYQGMAATDILSRGQQKMVISVIKLAQGRLFEQAQQRACIYLVDDLLSELDKEHSQLLAKKLGEMQSQVWVTGVDEQTLRQTFSNTNPEVFHVEHGNIAQV